MCNHLMLVDSTQEKFAGKNKKLSQFLIFLNICVSLLELMFIEITCSGYELSVAIKSESTHSDKPYNTSSVEK